MRYLGGKFRQRKKIVEAVCNLTNGDFEVYVEPFCGAMWSACAVIDRFPDKKFILNDVNHYLMTFWKAAVIDGWEPPRIVTEETYMEYRRLMPANDPMVGYIGFTMAFAGMFFSGPARNSQKKFVGLYPNIRNSTLKKMATLRNADVELHCTDFSKLPIPDGSMVYLDPPYDGRSPQQKLFEFDRPHYYRFACRLARRCKVIASEFKNPMRWKVLHNYGNTVVRHVGCPLHGSGIDDGTRELLMLVK